MTNALYVASLAVTGLIVVALALALLTVLWLLVRTTRVLDDVAGAIDTIGQRSATFRGVLGDINEALGEARDALRSTMPADAPAELKHSRSVVRQ